jgi:hypothetical protein
MAKLLSVKANRLPSKAEPGDVYYVTDQRTFFIGIADGSLINLADLLSAAVPHVRQVGPPGERGLRGAPGDSVIGPAGRDGKDSTVPGPKGEKGDRGSAGIGKDGRDGKDSVVPGPKGEKGDPGQSIVGPKGDKGDRGDITVVGDAELLAAIETLKEQKARVQARIITTLAGMGDHIVYRIARKHLEDILKEAQ